MTKSVPLPNPASSAARPVDAAEVRSQLAGKHVCPFCGVMRADAAQPCARCTLEDTQATRSATKQRIGPWFVLQARNPSAPGMKLATLQSLIRRGHITPRSVVRGPTTDQMWAFAANARGLSREFGLCYHCGESIDPLATRCAHCSKSQELPADHDAMMETLAASGAASMFSSQPLGAAPTPPVDMFSSLAVKDTGMDGGTSLDLQVGSGNPPADARPRLPAVQTRQLAQRAAMPPKEEAILSARELAAAFQLDFKNPTGNGRAGRPRRPVRTLAALLLIALVAGGIVLALRPDWRTKSQAWATDRWAALTASLEQPARPASPPPAGQSPVGLTPNPGAPGTKPPAAGGSAAPGRESTKPLAIRPISPIPAPTPSPVVVNPTPPEIVPTPPPVRIDPPKPVVIIPTPTPAPAPTPTPKQPDPTPIDNTPADLTIDQATVLASDLRGKAIDAQAKGDWAAALKLYEQIQRLPRDAWPADLPMRLEVAKRRAGV